MPSALSSADLPVVSPVCPAAERLDGPPLTGPAVICRAVVRDADRIDEILHGASATPLVTARKDPSTLFGFCCGQAMPRATEDEMARRGTRAHHTFCPVWEAEKKRIEENRETMRDPKRRGGSEAAQALLSGALRDVDKGDALEEWMNEPDED